MAAVAAERHGEVHRGEACRPSRDGRDGEHLLSTPRVPNRHSMARTVRAGRGDAPPAGVPGHTEDNNRMAAESDAHLAALRVPNLEWVVTGRSNPLAVRADRHGVDVTAVLVESPSFLALVPFERGRIPEADGPVCAG